MGGFFTHPLLFYFRTITFVPIRNILSFFPLHVVLLRKAENGEETMSLPSKLKELRQSKNWNQDYVANKLNISRSAVSKYETGRQAPSLMY
jgi:DNA-binding XRE family transcriptional regulator